MRVFPVMNDPGDRFFDQGDLRGLSLRPYVGGDEFKVSARADFAAALAEEGRLPDGPKWTLVEGGTVWAIGGAEPLGDGQWGAWAYAADMPPRVWLFGRWMAQAVLDWLWRKMEARHIAACAAPIAAARRLLQRMGFSPLPDQTDVFVMVRPEGGA